MAGKKFDFSEKNYLPQFHYHKLILFFLDYPFLGMQIIDFKQVIWFSEQ